MNKVKNLQVKLWISSVLGSLLIYPVIKQIWNDVNDNLLLILLICGFMINYIFSKVVLKNINSGVKSEGNN